MDGDLGRFHDFTERNVGRRSLRGGKRAAEGRRRVKCLSHVFWVLVKQKLLSFAEKQWICLCLAEFHIQGLGHKHNT